MPATRIQSAEASRATEIVRQKTPLATISTVSGLSLVFILTVFAVAPLFYPGYIQTHSGFVPIWNVADLRANLGDNLGWVPHIAANFDPLRSHGLLPYYLAALLPLSSPAAIKAVMALGWLVGGAGMFLWLRSWLGNSGALVAGLVYAYLPYQIVVVYVRGAWGETLFWGLLPWAILASTYLTSRSPVNRSASESKEGAAGPRAARTTTAKGGVKAYLSLFVAALLWLALALSQLGLAIISLILMAALLLTVHRPQALLPILSAASGILIAVALYFTLLAGDLFLMIPTSLHEHFLYPFQLFSAHWGFGPSVPGWQDDLSLQIGLAAIGLSIVTFVLWQRGESSRTAPVSRTDRRLLFFLLAALVMSLLLFSFSRPVWTILGSLVTYPWQLLGFVGLCLAVFAGAALWLDPQLARLPLLAAIIVVIILSVYSYLLPQFIQPAPEWLDRPQAELGEAQLALLDHSFSVLTPGQTAGLERGETSIPLSLHGQLRADHVLILNVTWQPLQTFDRDLKVFVHLVDQNDNVLAQFDGRPQEGDHPTSHWIPGEIIDDAYPILFPADAPPGPYRVFLGLYDETSLVRLPVPTDSEGRVILDVQ